MRTLSCNLQNSFLTYVYVVDPGAEQWPDKIVGLRLVALAIIRVLWGQCAGLAGSAISSWDTNPQLH